MTQVGFYTGNSLCNLKLLLHRNSLLRPSEPYATNILCFTYIKRAYWWTSDCIADITYPIPSIILLYQIFKPYSSILETPIGLFLVCFWPCADGKVSQIKLCPICCYHYIIVNTSPIHTSDAIVCALFALQLTVRWKTI